MSGTHSHSREDRLLQLVYFLWSQLPSEQQKEFSPGIEAAGMGWAIPAWDCRDDEDRLTVDEVARELGVTPAAVRNWHHRYGLTPVRGRYRWGDVIRRRTLRPPG